jgi:arsenate reductase (thioredoxin)
MAGTKKVLFLCSGNSARSQMAEGFLNRSSPGKWEARSGGVFASYVHPLAIRVMEEVGIDISEQASKSMDQFVDDRFDYVITLCDHAARFCPDFKGQGRRLNWSFDDPAAAVGSIEERLIVFRRVRDEIKARIDAFLESEASNAAVSNP